MLLVFWRRTDNNGTTGRTQLLVQPTRYSGERQPERRTARLGRAPKCGSGRWTPDGPQRTSRCRHGRWHASERSCAVRSTITHENDTSRQEMPREALGPQDASALLGGRARSFPRRSCSSRSRCVSLAACRAWLSRACPAAVEVIEARSASCRSHSEYAEATRFSRLVSKSKLSLARALEKRDRLEHAPFPAEGSLRLGPKSKLCERSVLELAAADIGSGCSENDGRARTAACGHARRATSSISLRVL